MLSHSCAVLHISIRGAQPKRRQYTQQPICEDKVNLTDHVQEGSVSPDGRLAFNPARRSGVPAVAVTDLSKSSPEAHTNVAQASLADAQDQVNAAGRLGSRREAWFN
jgi:hypothetical protein